MRFFFVTYKGSIGINVQFRWFQAVGVIRWGQSKWVDEPQRRNTSESKANVVSSFFCSKHELLKFDPGSRSQCLLTLTDRCHSPIPLTQAHFHLCFHFPEHAWPAMPVEHGVWATEQQTHGQTHSWGSVAVCTGYSTCYGAVGWGMLKHSWVVFFPTSWQFNLDVHNGAMSCTNRSTCSLFNTPNNILIQTGRF